VQIFNYDLVLSLPNNLIGFVPISAISDQFTERVKAFARSLDDDASREREQSPEDADSNSLRSVCFLGQYLRACVTAVNDKSPTKSSAKGKRRIELSINPRMANIGLSKSDLVPNVVVQASVISVEDHGLVMDVGTADGSAKGFVPTSELQTEANIAKVEPGHVFLCIVTSRSSNGKVVKLSTMLHKPQSGKKSGVLSDAPTIDAFLPGTGVEMAVLDVSPHGVAGKLMNEVDATADLFHAGKDFENEYKVGQRVRGRVICTFPKAEPKKVGISLLDHVRTLSALKVDKDGALTNPHEAMPNLTIVEDATVVKVVPSVGLWLNLGYEAVLGFAHISVVSDKRIESLSETDGPYKIGSKHRARLTGYNAVDGLYIVSLQNSVVNKVFMRYSDIEVGQVVKGIVERLITNENGISGLLISLTDDISGLVTGLHLSNVRLSHPEKKFFVGTPVTARVLTVDPAKRKMQLTLKRSLVQSELPLLTTAEPTVDDTRYLGTLMKVTSSGATLHFYNGVKGYLPAAEMSYAQIKNPQEHFHAGQVVDIRVIRVDKRRHRLIVSCKDAAAAPDDASADADGEPAKKKKKKKKATKQSGQTAEEAGEMGLKTAGFDWTADVLDAGRDDAMSDRPADEQQDDDDDGRSGKKKKRHKAATMQVDRTGDLDAHGPQSVSDFERLLLGEPDSSYLWLQYMAFQLQLGEVAKARNIAERALASIDMTEVAEKLNVWIALLNLENTYGTDGSLDSTFRRACQYSDPQDVHERLISIYIQSEKLDVGFPPSLSPLCPLLFSSISNPSTFLSSFLRLIPLLPRSFCEGKKNSFPSTLRYLRSLCLCIYVCGGIIIIITESRRSLPSRRQEVLAVAGAVAQLRHLPHDESRRARRRARPARARHAGAAAAPARRPDGQVCAARVPLAARQRRARAHLLRGAAGRVAEAARPVERAAGPGDKPQWWRPWWWWWW
jgi:ribosomal protein S1